MIESPLRISKDSRPVSVESHSKARLRFLPVVSKLSRFRFPAKAIVKVHWLHSSGSDSGVCVWTFGCAIAHKKNLKSAIGPKTQQFTWPSLKGRVSVFVSVERARDRERGQPPGSLVCETT